MSPIRPGSLCVHLFLLMGCGAQEVGPTARIDLTPNSMCEGATNTPIIVSGKRSLGLDGSSEGLEYAWSFSRPPARVIRGGTESEEIVVEFSTVVAVAVRLEIADGEGRTGVREQVVGLTRAARVPCSDGCEPHELCIPFASVDLCVDEFECAEDAECGCLVCQPDDFGTRRCVVP